LPIITICLENINVTYKGNKVKGLNEANNKNIKDVADPWYTRDFLRTYKDVSEGCTGLLAYILNNELRNVTPVVKSRLLSMEKNVSHGFSTRWGGVSEGYYSNLNLGLKTEMTKIRFLRI